MQSGPRRLILITTTLFVILGVSAFPRFAFGSPETPSLGTSALTPLLSTIIDNVNAIGDDAFSTVDPSTLSPPPTQHYGPYSTTNDADSGSCGNDWATDSFTRIFSIFSRSGSIVVTEQFRDGTFVTPAPLGDPSATPMSPGACNPASKGGPASPYDGGIVNPGIAGGFHGYYIIPLPPGVMETSNDSHCDAVLMTDVNCTTATFIDTHFTPCYAILIPTCSVTTFYFQYAAGDQGLVAHSWIDSSPDRAGEIGDIRSNTI
jgi:hypothetical protein